MHGTFSQTLLILVLSLVSSAQFTRLTFPDFSSVLRCFYDMYFIFCTFGILCLYFVYLCSGGSRGAGGPGPQFLAKSIYFFTLYTMSEKIFFEIEFGFYSGQNPSFWKCVGCMRVCVNRNRGRYCFLFSKVPMNDIRGHSDPKNICQIAGNRI